MESLYKLPAYETQEAKYKEKKSRKEAKQKEAESLKQGVVKTFSATIYKKRPAICKGADWKEVANQGLILNKFGKSTYLTNNIFNYFLRAIPTNT